MTGIQPLSGEVVKQVHGHDVVSPAYDALTVEQRRRFRIEHPDSYLNVTRSAVDEHDADTVDHATLVARGRASLEEILGKDLFQDHGEAAYYVYQLSDGDHLQNGLVCEVPSEHFAAVAKPHEATQPDRAALLAEHFLTVKAASSPVACAVRDEGQLEAALSAACQGDPAFELTTVDGLHQAVWRVTDPAVHEQLQLQLEGEPLFIIDGHHRSAANQQLLERGVSLPVLVAIFPEQSLRLVGFHRLVKLPAGLDGERFVHELRARFHVEITTPATAPAETQVTVAVNDQWYLVQFDERPVAGGANIRLGSLDPVVLQREVLQGIVSRFGPVDVTYRPDGAPYREIVAEAQAEQRVAIFVPPVAITDMMAVAEGGVIMPPKSTYFTPKVRSGVFLRLFDDLV